MLYSSINRLDNKNNSDIRTRMKKKTADEKMAILGICSLPQRFFLENSKKFRQREYLDPEFLSADISQKKGFSKRKRYWCSDQIVIKNNPDPHYFICSKIKISLSNNLQMKNPSIDKNKIYYARPTTYTSHYSFKFQNTTN
ncbi:hypothetical protein M0813_17066 [Anaeramoeba flamelloides]|uniref:Uncharacterized protein n=1 Tax=Anaeramoeba flamelloides TaxID=1746091 RepID=A0ABQ8YYJ3_9EUKA|nr:hypothetical protein M0813_17066 [Anaeramoeba flamelloides]